MVMNRWQIVSFPNILMSYIDITMSQTFVQASDTDRTYKINVYFFLARLQKICCVSSSISQQIFSNAIKLLDMLEIFYAVKFLLICPDELLSRTMFKYYFVTKCYYLSYFKLL